MADSELHEKEFSIQSAFLQGEQLTVPRVLPVLPLPDMVTFPFMIVPLLVSFDKGINAVDHALSKNRMILMVSQRNREVDEPTAEDMYDVGTVGIVIRMFKLPEEKVRVLVQGVARAKVRQWEEGLPYFQARIRVMEETPAIVKGLEMEALVRNVNAGLEQAAALGKSISQEMIIIAANTSDPGRLADLAASNLSLKVEEAQGVLATIDPAKRLRRIHDLLAKELELLAVQQQINTHAKDEIDKVQREYFLRQQLKAIQTELGEGNDQIEEIHLYQKKADEAKLPKEAREEFDRQLRRLERMHPDTAETATLRTYLDWMVSLPWSAHTTDNLNLRKARKILKEDHYGLDKIKERILEHLAVRKLNQDSKAPILCFVGPPGTGKTSLGKSVARALGRKFVRLSLGGVHDEAEIRGHRRTYVGALPGRIIQGLHQSCTNNPVFMMDEVDKLGADFRGDPSSALLEVLDPEQNFSFRDNYIGVPFDLTKVLFIMTANVVDTIQPAFRDRMEIIPISGYTEEEKVQIARRHLIAKQLAAHGLKPNDVEIPDPVVRKIIAGYTREAGLRNLEREIATICRKVAMRFATGNRKPVVVTAGKLHGLLGPVRFTSEERLSSDRIGIAAGLAWTPAGGEILFVEAQAMCGKGQLILTGQMGDVMKESAHAALSYARAHAHEYGIREDFFAFHDLHIHIPEGAIPKDGPSAGITLTAALISACTGRPVHREIAMTGEVTLRGDILAVGGIKEKILAAHRGRVYTIMLPFHNKKDLEEVPKAVRKNMKFVLVDKMTDVLNRALVR